MTSSPRLAASVFLCSRVLVPPSALRPADARPGAGAPFACPPRLRRKAGRRLLAGIEIALDKGFKTYWRNPGESGLPPAIRLVAARQNLGRVEVRWPAPTRTEERAASAYTYRERVSSRSSSRRTSRTGRCGSRLSLEYGVCKDICIPAQAELSLALSAEASRASRYRGGARAGCRGRSRSARRASFRSSPSSRIAGDKPGHRGVACAPRAGAPALFAEAPEDWYLSTSAARLRHEAASPSTHREQPKAPSGPVPLRLTLVAGDQAVESDVNLDAGGKPARGTRSTRTEPR